MLRLTCDIREDCVEIDGWLDMPSLRELVPDIRIVAAPGRRWMTLVSCIVADCQGFGVLDGETRARWHARLATIFDLRSAGSGG